MSTDKEKDTLPGEEQVKDEERTAEESQPIEPEPKMKKRSKKSSKEDEVSKAKQELGEMKEKYLRLYAEYDNFRRRTAKEKIELSRAGAEDLMRELLSVLDDTDRAIDAIERTEENKDVMEGVDLIRTKLFKTLEKNGLKSMDSKGKDFDTDHHEAVTQFPAPEDKLKGKVIEVVEKGYFLHDKVLRFAKVVVGT